MTKSIPIQELLNDDFGSADKEKQKSPLIPVQEEIRFVDRGWYLAVDFEYSSSGRFPQALEIAKKNPFFTELVDERGASIFRAIYFKNDFPQFLDLYDIIGKWKNTRFYFKGKEIYSSELEIWLVSFRAYWGHRRTLNITDYCGISKINPWPDFLGCYDRNIYLKWRDPYTLHYYHHSRMWYTFVKRTKEHFQLDKAAMRHYLSNLNQYYEPCPAYGLHLIEQNLQKLPNTIKIDRKIWTLREDYIRQTQQRGLLYHYDIALSILPELCPVSEKVYYKFLESCYR